MKKQLLLPLAALSGGAAALVLRLLQNRTGFEPDTGLPIPGSVPGLALVIALAALAVVLAVLSRLLPKEDRDGPTFPEDFRTAGTGLVTLLVAGIFLMAASGALDIAFGGLLLGPAGEGAVSADGAVVLLSIPDGAVTPRARILMGALALVSALSLFPAAACCRRRPGARPRNAHPGLLLIPPVCAVVRLVLAYRVYSVDPVLADYYVEILALTFLTLALYRLASFAYHAAKTRPFALCAGLSVVLSMAAVADAEGPAGALFYAGAALTMLGFLLLWLAEGQPVSEIVENGGE